MRGHLWECSEEKLALVSVLWPHDNPGHSWGLVSLNWALVKENWIRRGFLRKLHNRLVILGRKYLLMCVFVNRGEGEGRRESDRGRREEVTGLSDNFDEFSLSSRMFCRKCSKVCPARVENKGEIPEN